jgi:hypothetical protein
MKNIHVLPTDKPSRLLVNKENILVLTSNYYSSSNPQNIYITSDEEIKEGYWLDLSDNSIIKVSKEDLKSFKSYDKLQFKKIILTTDQDLIADGVQAIDDEFLEWFVKNPNCESVKVDLIPVNTFSSEITVNGYGFDKFIYKIIIPKEETENLKNFKKLISDEISPAMRDFIKEKGINSWSGKKGVEGWPGEEEPKQETGKETADYIDRHIVEALVEVDKQKMYSEEEVRNIVEQTIEKFYKHRYVETKSEMKELWFEQFKKK